MNKATSCVWSWGAFSLAALLVPMSGSHSFLPSATLVGEIAAQAPKAVVADEEEVIRLIEKLGGQVAREESLKARPVIEVQLANTKITAAVLGRLPHLVRLRVLD